MFKLFILAFIKISGDCKIFVSPKLGIEKTYATCEFILAISSGCKPLRNFDSRREVVVSGSRLLTACLESVCEHVCRPSKDPAEWESALQSPCCHLRVLGLSL